MRLTAWCEGKDMRQAQYEFGVVTHDGTIRYRSQSHRDCVEYIVRFDDILDRPKIARHDISWDAWDFDWYNR